MHKEEYFVMARSPHGKTDTIMANEFHDHLNKTGISIFRSGKSRRVVPDGAPD
jgi:hypothetical protein